MPKQVRTKVGEVHHVRTVKTFFDRVVEVVQVIGGIIVILAIIGLIFG